MSRYDDSHDYEHIIQVYVIALRIYETKLVSSHAALQWRGYVLRTLVLGDENNL